MPVVVGNVSRTHHPCGECHALVETCHHWRPERVTPGKKEETRQRRYQQRRDDRKNG